VSPLYSVSPSSACFIRYDPIEGTARSVAAKYMRNEAGRFIRYDPIEGTASPRCVAFHSHKNSVSLGTTRLRVLQDPT